MQNFQICEIGKLKNKKITFCAVCVFGFGELQWSKILKKIHITCGIKNENMSILTVTALTIPTEMLIGAPRFPTITHKTSMGRNI